MKNLFSFKYQFILSNSKRRLLFLSFIFVTATLSFCAQRSKVDHEFYIPVENSNLFIRMIGNPDGPLLIDLHGGPGAFSGFSHESYRKYLEEDYLIVYLDQRGGGKSDRVSDPGLLTASQFVKDLDVVVDTLKNRYQDKKVNLIGTSWGATLGLLYLISHEEKINSFACVSGKANSVYQYTALIEHERLLANALLETSDHVKEKNRYGEILEKLDQIENSGYRDFFDDMNLIKHQFPKELGFNAYWANLVEQQRAIAMSQDSAVFKRAHYSKEEFEEALEKMEFVNKVFRNTPSYNNMNILDEIGAITIPILVIQGEYDYNLGVKQASMIYDALKNIPEDKKQLFIIPDAAHNLNMEAPELYFGTVNHFLAKYNK